MDQAQQAELHLLKLQQEQQALLDFLESDGYKAAQKINQESIDENVSAIVDIQVQTLGDFFKLTDIISDTRVKLNFKTQFTERLADIERELGKNKKPQQAS